MMLQWEGLGAGEVTKGARTLLSSSWAGLVLCLLAPAHEELALQGAEETGTSQSGRAQIEDPGQHVLQNFQRPTMLTFA